MEFLKTRKAAALVLVLAVAFGTLYGSHRSLTAEANKIIAQNEMVMKDLQTRAAVGENLYTVASRYLSGDQVAGLRHDLDYIAQSDASTTEGMMAYLDLMAVMRGVLFQMSSVTSVTTQDAQYLAGFEAQLESGVDTIARDPYTALAQKFNNETLRGFPASFLSKLTGVGPLPIYE